MTLTRIERWLWYLFLATAAWQTRFIVWQADRTFIEWRSASFYFSDLLMLALFVCAVIDRPQVRIRGDLIDKLLAGFLLAALVSVSNADQFTVSMYQWVRLLQFAALFWYVRYRARVFDADMSVAAFVVGALAQSALALGQYALQHDVGLRWLGETILKPQMPGVAVFYDLAHTKILRAYGTLPHPNVLAVYLMTGLWGLGYLYLRHAHDQLRHHRWIWAAAGTMMLWALYFTYSRTMIAVGAVATTALCVYAWRFSVIRDRLRHIIIGVVIASAVFAGLFWRQIAARALVSSGEEAVQLRIYYARQALGSGGRSILDLNWTGVGIGNFTTWLKRNDPGHPTWWYQPAHNLYLLVYSETGIIGVGLFIAWLVFVMRSAIRNSARQPVIRWGIVMILSSFLAIALFDHFFWTLQQGRIIFYLVAGLSALHYGKRADGTIAENSR